MAIDLSLHEHQQLVQRSANELFRKRCTPEVVRDIEAGRVGYQPEVWREMAGLGWHGITFPEAYGGTGGSFLDLYPIYEEMGRFLVPTPHLDTVAVAGDVILHAGTEAQRDTLLPAIAEGRCIISLSALKTAKPDWLTQKKVNILLQVGLSGWWIHRYWPISVAKSKWESIFYSKAPRTWRERFALSYYGALQRDIMSEDNCTFEALQLAMSSGAKQNVQLGEQEALVKHHAAVLETLCGDTTRHSGPNGIERK